MDKNQIENEMIKVACGELQGTVRSGRILYSEQATVSYPDFNPCRAYQPIARVDIPALNNMEEVTLTHYIYDSEDF